MAKEFYKGIHPEDIQKMNDITKSIRKNAILMGSSMSEAAKKVEAAAAEFSKAGYALMEMAYLEEHGELPDVSRESQQWAVREWFMKKSN